MAARHVHGQIEADATAIRRAHLPLAADAGGFGFTDRLDHFSLPTDLYRPPRRGSSVAGDWRLAGSEFIAALLAVECGKNGLDQRLQQTLDTCGQRLGTGVAVLTEITHDLAKLLCCLDFKALMPARLAAGGELQRRFLNLHDALLAVIGQRSLQAACRSEFERIDLDVPAQPRRRLDGLDRLAPER